MESHSVHWITKEMLPNKGSFQIVYGDKVMYKNWWDGENGYESQYGDNKPADPREFKDKPYKQNIFDDLDYTNPKLRTIARDHFALPRFTNPNVRTNANFLFRRRLFLRHPGSFLSCFRQADGDGLFAARDLFTTPAAF